jgi:hypothetical protein
MSSVRYPKIQFKLNIKPLSFLLAILMALLSVTLSKIRLHWIVNITRLSTIFISSLVAWFSSLTASKWNFSETSASVLCEAFWATTVFLVILFRWSCPNQDSLECRYHFCTRRFNCYIHRDFFSYFFQNKLHLQLKIFLYETFSDFLFLVVFFSKITVVISANFV